MQIESAEAPGGGSPIEAWRREAAGMKLRTVPSGLPDMLGLADDPGADAGDPLAGVAERVLDGFRLGEMDLEVAMPVQTLEDFAAGARRVAGRGPGPDARRLARIAATCAEVYPTLRLHLFDGRAPSPSPSPSSDASARRSTRRHLSRRHLPP